MTKSDHDYWNLETGLNVIHNPGPDPEGVGAMHDVGPESGREGLLLKRWDKEKDLYKDCTRQRSISMVSF